VRVETVENEAELAGRGSLDEPVTVERPPAAGVIAEPDRDAGKSADKCPRKGLNRDIHSGSFLV
jgi:hypothetical protein